MIDTGLPLAPGPTAEQRTRARRVVASNATDAADCAELLAILGLDAASETAPGRCQDCGGELPITATTSHGREYRYRCRPCQKAMSV
ncbi:MULTISPECIES: hypothetical protein [unclassified Nocardia]|uniref:hypothetical protein n=1 Tax=unclassified Nocardia TaxID=2637762 RepID=UPI00278C7EB0|nr:MULTISPECIES: hypothetical protein [unclassified Nocardia]